MIVIGRSDRVHESVSAAGPGGAGSTSEALLRGRDLGQWPGGGHCSSNRALPQLHPPSVGKWASVLQTRHGTPTSAMSQTKKLCHVYSNAAIVAVYC